VAINIAAGTLLPATSAKIANLYNRWRNNGIALPVFRAAKILRVQF